MPGFEAEIVHPWRYAIPVSFLNACRTQEIIPHSFQKNCSFTQESGNGWIDLAKGVSTEKFGNWVLFPGEVRKCSLLQSAIAGSGALPTSHECVRRELSPGCRGWQAKWAISVHHVHSVRQLCKRMDLTFFTLASFSSVNHVTSIILSWRTKHTDQQPVPCNVWWHPGYS